MIVNNEIKNIFGEKYYDVVTNYISMIQEAINKYDVVIFMARKAYCFYKALLSIDVIKNNSNCIITSSRAATFNTSYLDGKNTVIIEDVIVQGLSLSEILNLPWISSARPTIIAASCSKEYYNCFGEKYNNNFISADPYMNDKELLEFATLISNFIVCQMIPYNIDYPIYEFHYDNYAKLFNDLSQFGYCSISKLLNYNKPYIEEGIIHINGSSFSSSPLLTNLVSKNTITKIRIYINKVKSICIFVPIAILPELNTQELIDLFEEINSNYIKEELNNVGQNLYKNLYKILQFSVSLSFGNCFIEKADFVSYAISNTHTESIIFPSNYKQLYINGKWNLSNLTNQYELNSSELYYSLANSYNLIIENCKLNSIYNNEFEKEFVSFNDIVSKITLNERTDTKIKIIASLMLDVFIDNGIVVPRIIESEQSVKRLYKFGEVARLTVDDFGVFANMLYNYADYEKRLLGRTEVEKVSVLFFKNNYKRFNSNDPDSESYRICFSKFGPRISSSNSIYKVSQNDALIEKLKEHYLIKEVDEKINIPHRANDSKAISVKERNLFANGLHKVHCYYDNAKLVEPNNYVFTYISSYTQMLTLLSIGKKEKDKITSLIAEVDLIKSRPLNLFKDERNAICSLQPIIDGVLSGVWKYYSYIQYNLLKDFSELLVNNNEEENILYILEKLFDLDFNDNRLIHKNFINLIGEFLIDVAIYNYYCCKFYNIPIYKDYNLNFIKIFLFNKKQSKTIFNSYKDDFSKDANSVKEFIHNKNNEIFVKANSLIDKFEVYESTSTFIYSEHNKCFVVYNVNQDRKIDRLKKLRCYLQENTIIYPIVTDGKYELTSLLEFYNDVDIRIIFYFSQSNILLSTDFKCFGSLFLSEIKRILSQAKDLSTNYMPEVIVPDNSFDEFNRIISDISGLSFPNYHDFNFHRFYYIPKKEETKMSIKIDKIYGDTIIGDYGTIEKSYHNEVFNFDVFMHELEDLKTKSLNKKTHDKIEEGIDACKKSKKDKVVQILKWLGENALDIIKEVSPTLISAWLSSNGVTLG